MTVQGTEEQGKADINRFRGLELKELLTPLPPYRLESREISDREADSDPLGRLTELEETPDTLSRALRGVDTLDTPEDTY